MSIRDYEHSRSGWTEHLNDGTMVTIHPICAADAERERDVIESRSLDSLFSIFLKNEENPTPELINMLTDIDTTCEAAFAALVGRGAACKPIGVSRYCLLPDGEDCECMALVNTKYRRKGLGTLLMRHLVERARARGIKHMIFMDAATPQSMGSFATHLGFQRKADRSEKALVTYTLDLTSAHVSSGGTQ
jgi:GNAT superfamily N-acetyltransferase